MRLSDPIITIQSELTSSIYPIVKVIDINVNTLVLHLQWINNSILMNSQPNYVLKTTILKNGIRSDTYHCRQIKGNERRWNLGFIRWEWKSVLHENDKNDNWDIDNSIEIPSIEIPPINEDNLHENKKTINLENSKQLSAIPENNSQKESLLWSLCIECFILPMNKVFQEMDHQIESIYFNHILNDINKQHIFTITLEFPPTCFIREESYQTAFSIFGPFTRELALLPDSPVSEWPSQIVSFDVLWSPRMSPLWDNEEEIRQSCLRVRYGHCVIGSKHDFDVKHEKHERPMDSAASQSTTDVDGTIPRRPWKYRAPRVQNPEIHFVRKVLCLGAFLLPHGNIYLCPASRFRFCINLQNRDLDFLKSKKVRKQLKGFRLSVNRVFPEALRLARFCHSNRSGGTWINDELSEMMWWFACHETPGFSVNNKDVEITRKYQFSLDTSPTLLESIKTNKNNRIVNIGQSNWHNKIVEYNTKTIQHTNYSDKCDDIPIVNHCDDEYEELFPLIRMYSFELWDVKTQKLVAATFTYIIGTVASDFTCLTLERDNRSCGTLLTRVVAEVLKKSNVTLWYWGSKLKYMEEFGRLYGGGIELESKAFYKRWWTEALGCQQCHQEMEFGKHRRITLEIPLLEYHLLSSRTISPSQSVTLFLCESCAHDGNLRQYRTNITESTQQQHHGSPHHRVCFYDVSKCCINNSTLPHEWYMTLLRSVPDVERFINDGLAPVLPLDFTPIVSMEQRTRT